MTSSNSGCFGQDIIDVCSEVAGMFQFHHSEVRTCISDCALAGAKTSLAVFAWCSAQKGSALQLELLECVH